MPCSCGGKKKKAMQMRLCRDVFEVVVSGRVVPYATIDEARDNKPAGATLRTRQACQTVLAEYAVKVGDTIVFRSSDSKKAAAVSGSTPGSIIVFVPKEE